MSRKSKNSEARALIPLVPKQHGVLLIRGGQKSDLEHAGNSDFLPRPVNNNQRAKCSSAQKKRSKNVKALKKIVATDFGNDKSLNVNDRKNNPLNLPSTSTATSSFSDETVASSKSELSKLEEPIIIENDQIDDGNQLQVLNGKEKDTTEISNSEEVIVNEAEVENWVGHVKPVHGIPSQAGNKYEEVMKAAKSLFSKRTRTLYHWLYPSVSKTRLKTTVTAAWDILSSGEKDFYISQVLGRFGVPACSLMVNPQLGGITNISSPGTSSNMDETHKAVANLLLSDENSTWPCPPQRQNESEIPRKRRRANQSQKKECPTNAPGTSKEDEDALVLQQIRDASSEDDFPNDPELRSEFEQFRWTLHVTNSQF